MSAGASGDLRAHEQDGGHFDMPLKIRPATPPDIAACIDIRGRTRENAVSATRLAELGITEATWSAQVRP